MQSQIHLDYAAKVLKKLRVSFEEVRGSCRAQDRICASVGRLAKSFELRAKPEGGILAFAGPYAGAINGDGFEVSTAEELKQLVSAIRSSSVHPASI